MAVPINYKPGYVDFVFDESATGIVSDVDSAACATIYVIFLCQDLAVLASRHDSAADTATNSIFDHFRY